jgi:hypothetical protein
MESIRSDIPLVEVTAPDGSRSLWAAAVAPENAVAVVARRLGKNSWLQV